MPFFCSGLSLKRLCSRGVFSLSLASTESQVGIWPQHSVQRLLFIINTSLFELLLSSWNTLCSPSLSLSYVWFAYTERIGLAVTMDKIMATTKFILTRCISQLYLEMMNIKIIISFPIERFQLLLDLGRRQAFILFVASRWLARWFVHSFVRRHNAICR